MMNNRLKRLWFSREYLAIGLTVAALLVASSFSVPALQEDAKFVAVEENGAKMWRGGGTINLNAHGTRPLTFKVINTLNSEHGFTIDTMKVKEVIKPGEEKTIDVPLSDIDRSVSAHRAYCHLHPKHVAAAFLVTMK